MYRPKTLTCKTDRAFTLIELLVVLVIVGLLATILIASISQSRQSVNLSKDSSNLRQLVQASILYAADNGGILPPTYNSKRADGTLITDTAWWLELFPAYVDAPEVFASPFDDTGYAPTTSGSWKRNGTTYREAKVSYGAIGHQSGKENYKASGRLLADLPDASRIALYINHQDPSKRLSQHWYGQHPRWISEVTFVHGEGTQANVAFVDGHIALLSREQINTAARNKSMNFGTVAY